ncbi:MAG: hypothetical protein E5Y73_09045 [Mesorhizobium sp.]|nr:MAG: hypothetical protein E5Y73_09045 [Mesorhizobium sp.]TIM16689.1 MAG: hypothetical protein E5Y67_01045 [Mesorhizobium sp.]
MGKNRTSARNIAPWRKRRWLPGPNETANYVLPIPLETTPQPTIRIRKRDRDRAERIRLAGGPKPKLRERAVRLALENLDGPGRGHRRRPAGDSEESTGSPLCAPKRALDIALAHGADCRDATLGIQSPVERAL